MTPQMLAAALRAYGLPGGQMPHDWSDQLAQLRPGNLAADPRMMSPYAPAPSTDPGMVGYGDPAWIWPYMGRPPT